MAVDIKEVKRLKELTGVGITDAKKALEETDGDFDKALEAMRVKGMAKADKKSEREAREGVVDSYVHSGRIGVLVEVNCETDFVARTDDFKGFVHDVAMHIAAANPRYLNIESIPEEDTKREEKLFREELENEGKKGDMVDKIVVGKVKKWHKETSLAEQPYIKNPDVTIAEFTKETAAKLGENLVIRRFSRIELGEN